MLLLAATILGTPARVSDLESSDPAVRACLAAARQVLEETIEDREKQRQPLAAAVSECSNARPRVRADLDVLLYTLGVLETRRSRTLHRNEVVGLRGFFWQEGAGIAVYEGGHLFELATLFPSSDLRDDALARLGDSRYLAYECEGSMTCHFFNETHAAAPLLLGADQSSLLRHAAILRLADALAELAALSPEQLAGESLGPEVYAALATVDDVLERGAGDGEARLRRQLAAARATLAAEQARRQGE